MAARAEVVILATRRSRLALAQTALVAQRLVSLNPHWVVAPLPLMTTGDQRQRQSLVEIGGKGVFTKEIEEALLSGEADLAVHSAKDLPTEMPAGLNIVGSLPRADARDVLVLRQGLTADPERIATGSPRRRAQLARLFPKAGFVELRGNVETRLRKIASGEADATVLAAAGLKRLGIQVWPGLQMRPLTIEEMVPAVGQGVIALQCRSGEEQRFAGVGDPAAQHALQLERAFLRALGGGCQTAAGGYFDGKTFYGFHEQGGRGVLDCGGGEADVSAVEQLARGLSANQA